MENQPIVIEREFDAPRMLIWQALTDAKEMKKWYFDVSSFEPVVGHQFQFSGIGEDGVTEYIHLCEVKEVVEGLKLSYSWRYKGYEGDSLLSFELSSEADNKTKLKLTHEGLESFHPDRFPAFAKKNFMGGWGYFMDEGLPKYLAELQKA